MLNNFPNAGKFPRCPRPPPSTAPSGERRRRCANARPRGSPRVQVKRPTGSVGFVPAPPFSERATDGYSSRAWAQRLHADRAAGGHCHHRGADRPAPAGHPEGARGRQPREVPEQPEATRPGHARLPRRPRVVHAGQCRRSLRTQSGDGLGKLVFFERFLPRPPSRRAGQRVQPVRCAEKQDTVGHLGHSRRPRVSAAPGLYLPVVSLVDQRLSGDELPLVHGQLDLQRGVCHRDAGQWSNRRGRGEADHRDHRWHLEHHPGQ